MTVAADMAQSQIVEVPAASGRPGLEMLDRRRFAAIERLAEAHRMTAAPAIVAVPLPDLGATLALEQVLPEPRRKVALEGIPAHCA